MWKCHVFSLSLFRWCYIKSFSRWGYCCLVLFGNFSSVFLLQDYECLCSELCCAKLLVSVLWTIYSVLKPNLPVMFVLVSSLANHICVYIGSGSNENHAVTKANTAYFNTISNYNILKLISNLLTKPVYIFLIPILSSMYILSCLKSFYWFNFMYGWL